MSNSIVILGDALQGGAANSTGRLTRSLFEKKVPIERWYFAASPVNKPDYYHSLDDRSKRPPLERILKNISRPIADEIRRKRHTKSLHEAVSSKSPTIINVRNIHDCGLDHNSLRTLPHKVPIIWTLHDCWPFDEHAFTWQTNGRIEHAASDRPGAIERRRNFFHNCPNTVLISPSKWLATKASKKIARPIRIEVIPNGITTKDFFAAPKFDAKAKEELDPDRIWIAFSATWANSRKGVDLLPAAFRQLNLNGLGLICWGGKPPLDKFPSNLPIKYVGHLRDPRRIASLYSAADLFLCPSRADNLPNTVLEAMACGTPVIGSRIGGIPDMVRPNKTGWLHESDDADALARAINQAIAEKDRWPFYRETARNVAVNEYDIDLCAQNYRNLYEELTPNS